MYDVVSFVLLSCDSHYATLFNLQYVNAVCNSNYDDDRTTSHKQQTAFFKTKYHSMKDMLTCGTASSALAVKDAVYKEVVVVGKLFACGACGMMG